MENSDAYRRLAIWHFTIGAALIDPAYRKRLIAKVDTKSPELGEIAPLIEALRKSDVKGVWSAMKAYWLEQEGDELVTDALLRKVEALSWGSNVSYMYNGLIKAYRDGNHSESIVMASELKKALEKLETKG